MRLLALMLISALSLASSSAFAASYQLNGGSIVDPIQCDVLASCVGDHPYSGPNLAPGVSAPGANLAGADLGVANLSVANLSVANLGGADLNGSNLSGSNLSGANLVDADLGFSNLTNANLTDTNLTNVRFDDSTLTGADFSGAILLNAFALADLLEPTVGIPFYNAETDFTGAWADFDRTIPFDPVAAGWTFVPEPGTALLMGLGLAGLAGRRR